MKTVCAVLAVSLAALWVSAAELRIAVVNLEEVARKYYKTTIAEGFISLQEREFQQHVARLNEELAKLDEEYKVLRDASQNVALDAIERESKRQEAEKKSRELMFKRSDIENYGNDRVRQLRELITTRRAEIFKDISEEVRRVATLEGYTLVLDSSGRGSAEELPMLLYFNASLDITERIIAELNRGNQLSAPPAKEPAATQP